MPREKKTTKRPRTTSTDSDRESTDSSRGSTASQPQSPTKKSKKNNKKPSGRDSTGFLDVPPPGGENIVISNPFEDDQTAATPSLRSLNTFSRQLNQQMMNCHFNPYQNSFNMPPSGYSNSMYNNHTNNSTNGPTPPVVYNPQGGPPMIPCGACHKEIGDAEAIHCRSSCNYWFHRTCVGLAENAYRLLTIEPLAEWVCDKCIREKKIPLVKMRTPQMAS